MNEKERKKPQVLVQMKLPIATQRCVVVYFSDRRLLLEVVVRRTVIEENVITGHGGLLVIAITLATWIKFHLKAKF